MMHTDLDLQQDVERVRQIPIVSTLLDVICQTTGMGFAAVARVTQDRWIACHVRDDIQFGLVAGDELKVETTICDEIRGTHQAVIIDHVQTSEQYCGHPTPLRYGFQSYISFPIFLKNGEFFGTLCAIDLKPAQLDNSNTIGLFTAFAELISFHL
ncbi:MAG TPA: GAF domain-containing protein, partial [Flavisolibacter sp.]|nr:GAF domain-containing protein [Flavisolibacter sp.]